MRDELNEHHLRVPKRVQRQKEDAIKKKFYAKESYLIMKNPTDSKDKLKKKVFDSYTNKY